jgi:hypothetical protein
VRLFTYAARTIQPVRFTLEAQLLIGASETAIVRSNGTQRGSRRRKSLLAADCLANRTDNYLCSIRKCRHPDGQFTEQFQCYGD